MVELRVLEGQPREGISNVSAEVLRANGSMVEGATHAPWTTESRRPDGGGCDRRTLDHRIPSNPQGSWRVCRRAPGWMGWEGRGIHSVLMNSPAGDAPFDRASMLQRLGAETFDIVVVGGGITGVGVA